MQQNKKINLKSLRSIFKHSVIIFLLIPFLNFAQNSEKDNSERQKLMAAAREIMITSGHCALITLDENNLPMARVMDPFLPETDFTVWFGTNTHSRKVTQIKNNPNVTLYYFDKDTSAYVVIHGIAQIVDDQSEKDAHWKVGWEAFYPNSREDYLLIKFSPKWMEVISYKHGIFGDPKTWQTPVVHFN